LHAGNILTGMNWFQFAVAARKREGEVSVLSLLAPRLMPALHTFSLAHVAKSHEFQYLPTHPSSLLTISSCCG